MMTHFSSMFGSEINQERTDLYYDVLKPYSDKQVTEAGYKCLEELEFFPKPAQVVKRIPKEDDHNKELRKRFTCPICKAGVSLIIEGKCRMCHSGTSLKIPRPIIRQPPLPKDDFLMEDNIRCEECGTIAKCIKEPSESGKWQCRQCYSGISIKEHRERMRKLGMGVAIEL